MISLITFSFKFSDIFSLLIVLTIIYVSHYYYRYFTRINPLPGPFPLPIIGNIHQKIGYNQNDWLLSLHEKYGDMFEIYLTGNRNIIVCKEELIGGMNATSTKTKYPIRFIVTEGFIEYGLTGVTHNNNYKSWKYNRQFFSQALMTPSFNKQAIEWTNELWQEMETYWNNFGEDHELNLAKWMLRFTNEVIFKIATGTKNNAVSSYYHSIALEDNISLEEKEKIKESENFVNSIDTYVHGMIYFFFFKKFVRKYVPFIRGKVIKLLENKDYLLNRVLNIIKKRRLEVENTPLDQPLSHDILTSYITANTTRDINNVKHADADLLRPMNDSEIVSNLVDAIVGGTDTTANLFTFIAYFLGKYPKVKQRLREEFDQVFGKDLTKPITLKDLDELHYCEAVIKEVYRFCPIVFFNSRLNIEQDNVGGFNWPEGTSFQIFYSAMSKRKDYWTDPEKFDPDRFYKIDGSDKYLPEQKHAKNAFTIFGGGIRMCPGRRLAMIELRCLLVLIYRKYDIELADINAPLKLESDVINTSKELMVKIKPRKF